MPARINHNAHLNLLNHHLSIHHTTAARQIGQLASGQRVERSSDDPASLALANDIRAEVHSLAEGNRNVQQTVQLLQVLEGTLSTITDMAQRMQELATQSASDTYRDADRVGINAEFQRLKEEMDRVARSTSYNGMHLLNTEQVLAVQSGPSATGSDVGRLELHDLRIASPRLAMETLTIGNRGSALQAMDHLAVAQGAIMTERNRVAAFQNRLQLNALTSARVIERMQQAGSAVQDADIAATVTRLSQAQLLSQASVSVAMEADTDIDRILALLRG